MIDVTALYYPAIDGLVCCRPSSSRGFPEGESFKKFLPELSNIPLPKVIRFHTDAFLYSRWIGVDLNTTGHAVVAADLISGKIMKLGKRLHYRRTSSTKNCTKLYHEKKLWKLKKIKSREKKEFKAALHKIAQQIIRFAEASSAGIKFEKLFSFRHMDFRDSENPYEFSFENSSFVSLLHLVEKRALSRGIPVLYVNPTNTSKRCSRCGRFGHRVRKRFDCPHCGAVIHADVNAAFNIAAASHDNDKFEIDRMRMIRKEIRRKARTKVPVRETINWNPVPDLSRHQEITGNGDTRQVIFGIG
jgi:IS605 OrfB family transposase